MDPRKFREIEGLYKELKERQAAGEVSAEDAKTEMKKMMLRDEENRFWMLGGKSGSWYVYDGSSWTAADPYAGAAASSALPGAGPAEHATQPAAKAGGEKPPAADPARTAVPSSLDAANRLQEQRAEGAAPETLCRFCHSRMDEHDAYCRFCGASPKAATARPERRPLGDEIHVRGVNVLSWVIFFGGLGLVLGVVFGATFGIFNILGDLIFQFPVMLQEMRGKFLGGLFFGALGGIVGFVAFALLGLLKALFFNALCFVFTGPRLKIRG